MLIFFKGIFYQAVSQYLDREHAFVYISIDGVVKSPIYCVVTIFHVFNILHVCIRV